MNTADINTKLIDSYISLLKNMSAKNKLDLISKLTNTVKTKDDHFAKILIQDAWATSDTSSSHIITHSGSLTMKWEYQPDGSREF